jgi:hypothetical protein
LISHERIKYLGSLNVVVEVVAESLDVRNDIGHPLGREVTGEEDYRC